jgi:hypothetical protein
VVHMMIQDHTHPQGALPAAHTWGHVTLTNGWKGHAFRTRDGVLASSLGALNPADIVKVSECHTPEEWTCTHP